MGAETRHHHLQISSWKGFSIMILFLEKSIGKPCPYYWWQHRKQQHYFSKEKCTSIHGQFCFITFVNCPEFKAKRMLVCKFMFVCITQYISLSAGESMLREWGNGFRNMFLMILRTKWSCLRFKVLWCQWKVSVPAALFFQGTKYWTNSVVWKDMCIPLEKLIAISEHGYLRSSWKKETVSLLPVSCYIN